MANIPSLSSPDVLVNLPPSLLKEIPALQPPPGVESNFLNPERRTKEIQSVATFLLCLTTLMFANRIYMKSFIIRKASWDDLTCTIGFLGSVANYICSLWGATKGPYGKHQWDVNLTEIMSNNFIMPSYLVPILAPSTLLFIKVTFFLLYYQVFRPLRWLRLSVYIGATLTAAFYGAATVAQLVFTTRRQGETWFKHFLSKEELKANKLSVPLAAVGLGIDIMLLAMPIGAVMGLQLPTKRKVGILSIFMFGILACVGSILSIYYRVIDDRSLDTTWNTLDVELMTLLEMNIGIICLSLPAFSKTLHHHLPPLNTLRSRLHSQLVKLQSKGSHEVTGRSRTTRLDGRDRPSMMNSDQGPYVDLQDQPRQSQTPGIQPAYQMGDLNRIKTFIRRGADGGASDDKIHLTYSIEQEQARLDKTNIGR